MNYFVKNKEITAVSEKDPLFVTMVGSSDGAMVDLLGQILQALQVMTNAINSLKDTLITESDETQEAINDLKTPLIEVPFAIESLAPQENINEVIPVAVELDKTYDVSIADGYNDTNIVETATLVDDNVHLNIHYTGSGAVKPAKTIIIKIKQVI